MSNDKISRRNLLKGALAGVAAVPAAALLARTASAAAPVAVKENEQFAYHVDAKTVDAKKFPTYKPGQTCANCIQYTAGKGGADGTCTLFPGKTVKPNAWCQVWVKKP